MGRRLLNQREQRFVQGLAQGLSHAEAARRAGFSPITSTKKAYAMVDRPLIRTALTVALAQQGVTMAHLVQPIIDALHATRLVKRRTGLSITDFPDHKIRLEAAQLALRLHGALPRLSELPESQDGGLTVNIMEAPNEHAARSEVGPAGEEVGGPLVVNISCHETPDTEVDQKRRA